jgi:adenylylsulfate kinase
MLICRLVVDDEVAEERLRSRHASDPEGLRWHLTRIRVLSAILDHAQFDDLVVDTTNLDANQVSAKIHHAVGWG